LGLPLLLSPSLFPRLVTLALSCRFEFLLLTGGAQLLRRHAP